MKTFYAMAMAMLLAGAAQAKAGKGAFTGVVNVNEAGVAQLMLLPGVGPKKAQAIRDYAAAHPFKSVEELKEVKGISDRNLEKLRPHVTLSKNPPAAPVQSALPR